VPKKYAISDEAPAAVSEGLSGYPPVVQRLLFNRGIKNADEAALFLDCDYAQIHDPFLLKDAEKASSILLEAFLKNDRVLIWGDYDADGLAASALLSDFFDQIGFRNYDVYLPDRNGDGFGLNEQGIKDAVSGGVKLIITVDCGSSDFKETVLAKELGLKIIITDHHEAPARHPPADAFVNPKREDCPYPGKMICGTAVAFKIVCAVLKKNRFDMKEGAEKWLLDLVGIATVSDMVPLIGENRIFAKYGLLVLRKTRRFGLKALFRKLRMKSFNLAEDDIGFMIAPRLNAASRMGQAGDAYRLLVTRDGAEATELSEHLDHINNERKGLVASMVRTAREKIMERENVREAIVAGHVSWKPSLLGLVASALAEHFKKPAFIWGDGGGVCLKGSCRSDGKVDVTRIMAEAKYVFEDYGGHKMSGGFSVDREKIHLLEDALCGAVLKFPEEAADVSKMADMALRIEEVEPTLYSMIERLAPYGVGNPKPIFLLEDVSVSGAKMFGKDGTHLELALVSGNSRVKAISFFAGKGAAERFTPGQKISLAANLEKSTFRDYPEYRLRIVDILS